MRRLQLDSIAIPLVVFPQHPKIAHKVPPRGADLAELRRVPDDRIADGDATVARGEGHEALEGTREGEADRPVGGACRQRKRDCTVEGVLHNASQDRTVGTPRR